MLWNRRAVDPALARAEPISCIKIIDHAMQIYQAVPSTAPSRCIMPGT